MVTVNHKAQIKANGQIVYDEEYKGLSTDAKPNTVAINTLFLELDTGNFFYFTGESWAKVGA